MARSTCFAPFRLAISPGTHMDRQLGTAANVVRLTTLATLHKSETIDGHWPLDTIDIQANQVQTVTNHQGLHEHQQEKPF